MGRLQYLGIKNLAQDLSSERILNYDGLMTNATASLQSRTFQSSDLSRHPQEVFAAAEDQPVDVTRRDGEDLVLMSKKLADAREQLFALSAQLITVTLDDRGTLADRMSKSFPWMLALNAEDRRQCAEDLVDTVRASLATGQSRLVARKLTSWKETAAAVAAGLGRTPVEWLDEDEDEPVERP